MTDTETYQISTVSIHVLTSRGRALRLVVALLCFEGAMCLAAPTPQVRAEYLRLLFARAIDRPVRSHIEATIEHRRPPMPPLAQAKYLEIQRKVAPQFVDTPAKEAHWRELTARAVSGHRIRTVSEWFSGRYARCDENDDARHSAQFIAKANGGYLAKTVTGLDSSVSQYTSWQASEPAKTIALTRGPKGLGGVDNLWAAKGIDADMIAPVLSALTAVSPDGIISLAKQHFFGVEQLRIDETGLASLAGETSSNWRVEISEISSPEGRRLRYVLKGLMTLDAPYEMRAVYNLLQLPESGDWVFESGVCENVTQQRTYRVQRYAFSPQLIPLVWNVEDEDRNGQKVTRSISIRDVDFHPDRTDESLFRPPVPKNLPTFKFIDVTHGKPVILYDPNEKTLAQVKRSLGRRTIIEGMLIVSSIGIAIVFGLQVRRQWA